MTDSLSRCSFAQTWLKHVCPLGYGESGVFQQPLKAHQRQGALSFVIANEQGEQDVGPVRPVEADSAGDGAPVDVSSAPNASTRTHFGVYVVYNITVFRTDARYDSGARGGLPG